MTSAVASRLTRLARRILGEGGEPDTEKVSLLASLSEAMVPPLSQAERIVAAADRAGPERLCRYGLRPAFS